ALAGALTAETLNPDADGTAPLPLTQLATQANLPAPETGDLASKTIAGRYQPARIDTLNRPAYVPTVEADGPARGPGLKIGVAAVLFVVMGAAAGLVIWKRQALFGGRERVLTYSLTVQKMRDGKPFQNEFESSGQEIFENGWKFRLIVEN